MEKVYPNVTVVNERDEVLGYMQLFDAIAAGAIRRIAAIFIFDETGRVLIQRRSAHVLSPNLLDYSVAGHVNEGQEYLSAAEAELLEELGIQNVVLESVLPPFPTPGFFNGVFRTVISSDTAFVIDPEEVASVFWVSFPELQEMIERHPQQFTESFLTVWSQVCDKIRP